MKVLSGLYDELDIGFASTGALHLQCSLRHHCSVGQSCVHEGQSISGGVCSCIRPSSGAHGLLLMTVDAIAASCQCAQLSVLLAVAACMPPAYCPCSLQMPATTMTCRPQFCFGPSGLLHLPCRYMAFVIQAVPWDHLVDATCMAVA